MGPLDHDLTCNAARNGEALGERIVVAGQVLDEDGRPQPDTLIEIWPPTCREATPGSWSRKPAGKRRAEAT